MPLTDRNMQVRFYLKIFAYSWGLEIWFLSTSFWKNNIGWPQQPLTEKELNFKMGFHDSVKKNFFQNTKISDISPQIIHFKNLDDSVVTFQASQTSAVSLTSLASVTSLASTASKAIFPQITSWSWWFGHHRHQNVQNCSFFVEWIIKNPIFY